MAALAWAAMLASAVPHDAVSAAAPPSCEALARVALPDTTISAAENVQGPSFTPPGGTPLQGLPAFCRVAAVTRPAVKFEVWLPRERWNGKFQGVGNGANAGAIGYPAMAAALRRGYATAGTDTGHATTNGRDATWAIGHPELVVDFAWRAIHVTADNAKKITGAFYGSAPQHSYFMSCSTGGRQALMEAQRFPDDYDGIVAGAPAANWTRFQTGGHLWVVLALNKEPGRYIPAAKLPAIAKAVNAACDRLDGIADGVLDDPRACRVDPQSFVCPAGEDRSTCLTPKQADALRDIWSGARDRSGAQIYPGYMPGAEDAGGWAGYMSGSGPMTGSHWDQAENVLKYLMLDDPKWDFRTFDYDRDLPKAEARLGAMFDAFDPDLTRFRARGGKLILYHGWNDPSISPLNTIAYYEKVVAMLARTRPREQAEAQARQFARVFMAPGMLHCGGGPGPNTFDALASLEAWVENGEAPERIVASHTTAGVVDRTRPLCPYPQVAAYTGSGSTDDAANFVCRAPAAAAAAGASSQAQAGAEADPGVRFTRLIDRAEVRVSRLELQPGAERRVHQHDDVEYHLWVPLEGQLEITIGNAPPVRPAAAGQAFFMQRGTPHGFKNIGSTPATALEIFVKQTTAQK
jgi:quercetin dioxygenase-like cupin family protein